MKVFLNAVKAYFTHSVKNRFRLITACITTLILYLVSWNYLFTGFNKTFITFTFLCFAVGGFILFPPQSKYTFLPVTVLYLLMIPKKMFERIELPIHDFSRIQDGVPLANILIILAIFALLLLFTQKINLALGIGSLVLLLLFLINYYVFSFRGSGLSYNDLMATGTAMKVIDNYKLFLNTELWYSILYFIFFAAFGFWCTCPFKGKWYHVVVSATALLYLGYFYYFWNYSSYLEEHHIEGHYWNMSENGKMYGFLLSFAVTMKENSMEKPADYSTDSIDAIVESADSQYSQTNIANRSNTSVENPNIIIIMNEAWSDLRVLGNLETSEPFMPFTDSLTENTIRGNVHVGILGGLTANSEFETITGDTLAFLSASAIPYQLQVNHDMPSLATVLKEQGYYTIGMHAGTANAWNRDNVYGYFGFDDFIDANEFHVDYEYYRTFISDQCNYNEIIYQYENKEPGTPLFIFDVTIQNHGDYYKGIDMPITVETVGGIPAEQMGYTTDIETYINFMKLSDDAFASLIAYFEQVEEPTIICMYGDHQPNLSEEFYETIFEGSYFTYDEQIMQKYITPYVIWTNYDSDFKDYGKMSANYLGAVVLECAGVELPDYYKFLLNLHQEYPVLSLIGCINDEQRVYPITELLNDPLINKYRILQYNHLIDRNYRTQVFSVAK